MVAIDDWQRESGIQDFYNFIEIGTRQTLPWFFTPEDKIAESPGSKIAEMLLHSNQPHQEAD
ncbi:MAG: hypothetical protein I8H70_06575 [Burkholderiales bacterium]|nr:hypothetical protein [Burkholderiales bacterium]